MLCMPSSSSSTLRVSLQICGGRKVILQGQWYRRGRVYETYRLRWHAETSGPVDGDDVAGEDRAPLEGGAGAAIGAWTPDMIADLLKINADQKRQVDSLISKMSSLTTAISTTSPLPVHHPLPVSAGTSTTVSTSVTTSFVSLSTQATGGQPGVTSWAGQVNLSPYKTTTFSQSNRIPAVSYGVSHVGGQSPISNIPPVPSVMSTAMVGSVAPVAPADVMTAPLTSALDRLSLAIDPSMTARNQGSVLRLEFYVQHLDQNMPLKNIDHNNLSYASLSYGMCRVAKHLCQSGGDFKSYLDHMLYVFKLASLG